MSFESISTTSSGKTIVRQADGCDSWSIKGHSKVDHNINDKDYKVSVSYRRSILPDERNDLFWFNSSNINSKDIIITFDSPGYPFDISELSFLEAQGFSSNVINKKGVDLTGTLPVYYSVNYLSLL